MSGLKSHRYIKQGISVKWHCTECNINLESSSVNGHILMVHVGKKKLYECSLCDTTVFPSTINLHDRQSHGGLGKAHIVNNLHHYKSQVEALHKKLMVDLNSSSSLTSEKQFAAKFKPKTSTKSWLDHIHRKPKRISQKWSRLYVIREGSKKSEKLTEIGPKKTNSDLTCKICGKSVPSAHGLILHRYYKHGISLKWYCLQCNVNLAPALVNTHLLCVHIGIKKLYECSLCGTAVAPGTIDHHDQLFHGGHGKAQTLNNKQLFKLELEALRKKLIIDLNASFVKLDANLKLETKMPKRAEESRNSAKLAENEPKRSDPFRFCEICSQKFSATGIKIHKAKAHGIFIKWHCKECNIDLNTKSIDRHLLNVHIGKQVYVCNLCDTSVSSQIDPHDKSCHNGLGKARAIYNVHRYRKEIKELRDTWIIDVNTKKGDSNSAEKKPASESKIIDSNLITTVGNSIVESSTSPCKSTQILDFHAMVKVQNFAEKNAISQPKHIQESKSMSKLQSILGIRKASDNLRWLSRFKRSQKRKQKHKKVDLQMIFG